MSYVFSVSYLKIPVGSASLASSIIFLTRGPWPAATTGINDSGKSTHSSSWKPLPPMRSAYSR